MSARIHRYQGEGVRAEVTPYEGLYRVNVLGPHHPRGLLPIITEKSVEEAVGHAERLAMELYPHACDEAGCGGWEAGS
jgi:hypothetical protein